MRRTKLKEDAKREQREKLIRGAQTLKALAPPRGAYQPEMCDLARRCCIVFGATDVDLGRFLGVDPSTIDQWRRVHPEFDEACRPAKERANAEVVMSLFKRALGYDVPDIEVHKDKDGNVTRVIEKSKHIPGDVTAQIFWNKNRDPVNWRDRIDPAAQVNHLTAIKFESLSDQQLEIVIQRLTEDI